MRTAEAIALDCDGDDYYRRCPDCGGSGSQAGKVSSDGGRTWSRFDSVGQAVYLPCSRCQGSGCLDPLGRAICSRSDYKYAGAEG